MIVEIAGGNQPAGHEVHASDSAFACGNSLGSRESFGWKRLSQRIHTLPPARPNIGVKFQPPFPVAAPTNLLEPFFGFVDGIVLQGFLNDLIFQK